MATVLFLEELEHSSSHVVQRSAQGTHPGWVTHPDWVGTWYTSVFDTTAAYPPVWTWHIVGRPGGVSGYPRAWYRSVS